MEKKEFNKITKEVFTEYGFCKEKNRYILYLDDVTIIVRFSSWRGVKSFNYYFFINALHSDSSDEGKYDVAAEFKMEHNPSSDGYPAHEILYERWSAAKYRRLLTNMLHLYFDPYKEDALQFLKESGRYMGLLSNAEKYLGIE